jgi:hypothetical protein
MIALMDEHRKHQGILSQYLMEKRHGRDPSLFGGNHDVSGSHGGNGNHEESIHKGHAEGNRTNEVLPTKSNTSSIYTSRPYMPTFLDEKKIDTNSLNHESIGDEWETKKREYNTMRMGSR